MREEFRVKNFQKFVEWHHFLSVSTVWVEWTNDSGGFHSGSCTLFGYLQKYQRVCPSPTHKAFFINQPAVTRTILNALYLWMLINSCKNDFVNLNILISVYQTFKVPVKLPLSSPFFNKFSHPIQPIILICYFWPYITLLDMHLLVK